MLISCPDCKKQISDQAPTCPSCGCPKPEPEFDIKTYKFVMPDMTPKCPLCKSAMIRMDASARGQALSDGNIIGSLSKTLRCSGCGHLS